MVSTAIWNETKVPITELQMHTCKTYSVLRNDMAKRGEDQNYWPRFELVITVTTK